MIGIGFLVVERKLKFTEICTDDLSLMADALLCWCVNRVLSR